MNNYKKENIEKEIQNILSNVLPGNIENFYKEIRKKHNLKKLSKYQKENFLLEYFEEKMENPKQNKPTIENLFVNEPTKIIKLLYDKLDKKLNFVEKEILNKIYGKIFENVINDVDVKKLLNDVLNKVNENKNNLSENELKFFLEVFNKKILEYFNNIVLKKEKHNIYSYLENKADELNIYNKIKKEMKKNIDFLLVFSSTNYNDYLVNFTDKEYKKTFTALDNIKKVINNKKLYREYMEFTDNDKMIYPEFKNSDNIIKYIKYVKNKEKENKELLKKELEGINIFKVIDNIQEISNYLIKNSENIVDKLPVRPLINNLVRLDIIKNNDNNINIDYILKLNDVYAFKNIKDEKLKIKNLENFYGYDSGGISNKKIIEEINTPHKQINYFKTIKDYSLKFYLLENNTKYDLYIRNVPFIDNKVSKIINKAMEDKEFLKHFSEDLHNVIGLYKLGLIAPNDKSVIYELKHKFKEFLNKMKNKNNQNLGI